jgi:hypothetical protein
MENRFVTPRRDVMRRVGLLVFAGIVGLGLWAGSATLARAQAPDAQLGRYFYYPYYYFPHNYWPQQSPKWPEPPGAPYMRPPGYMAYPAFTEPHWRYEWLHAQRYYRGFHFWLDQF